MLLEARTGGCWDQLLIRRGLAALERAELLAARGKPVGPYFLQAPIAACHARAATRRGHRLASRSPKLYDVLAEAATGPIVEVNRAVAHGRAFGPGAGLARARRRRRPTRSPGRHLVPSVRGDLLERAGRHAEAAAAFTEAAGRTGNEGRAHAAARPSRRESWLACRNPTELPSDARGDRTRPGGA